MIERKKYQGEEKLNIHVLNIHIAQYSRFWERRIQYIDSATSMYKKVYMTISFIT